MLQVDTKITESELKVWHAVAVYKSTHGVSPTLGELAVMCGYKATSSVARHLEALELKGLIRRDRAMSRSIELVKDPPSEFSAPAPGLAGRILSTRPLESPKADYLELGAIVTLEVISSHERVQVPLDSPAILGRKEGPGGEDILDLSDHDAYRLGVSRRHCMLQRHGTYLLVTDLGSSNGTFLNDKRILPSQHHIVAHADKLTLGALHLTVNFSTEETAPKTSDRPTPPA
jgi:hypothetical protein